MKSLGKAWVVGFGGYLLASPAFATTETFEGAGFVDHADISSGVRVGAFDYTVSAGGSLRSVTSPAALFPGYDPAHPVTELRVTQINGAAFRLLSMTAADQFEMADPAVTVTGFRNGVAVTPPVTVTIPWPTATLDFSGNPAFAEVDEVRIAGSDPYFFLEDWSWDAPVLNTPPVAVNDAAYSEPGQSVSTGNVLANDSDPDGDALNITGFANPSAHNGAVVNHGNGTFAYTAADGFSGTDSFAYTIADGRGGTATGTVSVVVSADWDDDGMPNTWEQSYGLDPYRADAALDNDGDGLTNLAEYTGSTDPTVPEMVAIPVFGLAGGAYETTSTVTLSTSTSGGEVRYTTDGSEPTASSSLYTGPLSFGAGAVTVKAQAFKSGWSASGTVSASYTFVEPMVLKDGVGQPLTAASVRVNQSLTIVPTAGSGSYSVSSGANTQGAVGTVVDNGDGSWSFVPPKSGSFAGEYVITVTDNVTGATHDVTITVPLRVTANKPSVLGTGSAAITVKGAAAGTVIGLDVKDGSGNDMEGLIATLADATAADDAPAANPAPSTLFANDIASDAKVRVTASATGYPAGQSGLLTVIAADTYTGTVVDAGSTAVNGATVMAKDLADGLYQPYRAQTDASGHFTLIAPKATTELLASMMDVGRGSVASTTCLSPCTVTLAAPGGGVLNAQSGVARVTDAAQHVAVSLGTKPVIIAGIPTGNGRDSGVARVSNVTWSGFDLRFQEWEHYIDDLHIPENIAWLALAPGRYELPDGSVWEVGTLSLHNTGVFKRQAFGAPFPGTPRLFLTVQSTNEASAVMVRAKGVTATEFKAALFEQEASMASGHAYERVGYLAIYTPAQVGRVMLNGTLTDYSLAGARVRHFFTPVLEGFFDLRLHEEPSLDAELDHKPENIDLLLMGTDQLFGQDVSTKERDTAALRYR